MENSALCTEFSALYDLGTAQLLAALQRSDELRRHAWDDCGKCRTICETMQRMHEHACDIIRTHAEQSVPGLLRLTLSDHALAAHVHGALSPPCDACTAVFADIIERSIRASDEMEICEILRDTLRRTKDQYHRPLARVYAATLHPLVEWHAMGHRSCKAQMDAADADIGERIATEADTRRVPALDEGRDYERLIRMQLP